jgi:hypothetical protein
VQQIWIFLVQDYRRASTCIRKLTSTEIDTEIDAIRNVSETAGQNGQQQLAASLSSWGA